ESHADFTSCGWITYRSHFPPIRDSSLTVIELEKAEAAVTVAAGVETPISSGPPSKRWWQSGETGWTSDTGRGCMLRTGQSLLATALIHRATFVQILTWFFDSPSTMCPSIVYRMALAGKELGKDVGQ
ncbi:hypothetical protein EI94DRAFT_1572658, partial [Lactarius quietus]